MTRTEEKRHAERVLV